jgi:hypothetical protein
VASTDPPEVAPGAPLRLRKYIPITVEEKLTFTLFRASIADISTSGARVITSEYLSKGTKWVVTMKAPPSLTVRAEVRWVKMDSEAKPGGTPQFQVGIQFLDMTADEQKRLASFLEFEQQRTGTG